MGLGGGQQGHHKQWGGWGAELRVPDSEQEGLKDGKGFHFLIRVIVFKSDRSID